jgi:uncharacterized protein YecE (DUF72 family)
MNMSRGAQLYAGTSGFAYPATPAGFLFAVKAHNRITHVLRLRDASEFTEVFLRAIDPLRATRRLGPILLQLPPQLHGDSELLSAFVANLPADFRYAFEFRDTTWFTDQVYNLLRKHNISLCVAESDKLETPEVLTADFVYYRLRKPGYALAELEEIREKAEQMVASGRDLFLFFKHEDTPQGALYAEELLRRR